MTDRLLKPHKMIGISNNNEEADYYPFKEEDEAKGYTAVYFAEAVDPELGAKDARIAELEAEVKELRKPNIWGIEDGCVMHSPCEQVCEYDPGDTMEVWANRTFGFFKYEVIAGSDGNPDIGKIVAYSKNSVKWTEVYAKSEWDAIQQAKRRFIERHGYDPVSGGE